MQELARIVFASTAIPVDANADGKTHKRSRIYRSVRHCTLRENMLAFNHLFGWLTESR